MGILEQKKIVLLNYPLGLSLLKYRNVWVFWNKKKSDSNRCNPLNSSIDKFYYNKATPHVVDHPRVSISDTIFVIPVLKLIQKCHVVLI